jgi:hypothetical protein
MPHRMINLTGSRANLGKMKGRLGADTLVFDALPIVSLTSSFVSAGFSDLVGLFYRLIMRLSILSPLRMPFRYLGELIPCLLDTKVACRR